VSEARIYFGVADRSRHPARGFPRRRTPGCTRLSIRKRRIGARRCHDAPPGSAPRNDRRRHARAASRPDAVLLRVAPGPGRSTAEVRRRRVAADPTRLRLRASIRTTRRG
jgi:hypothetical protein